MADYRDKDGCYRHDRTDPNCDEYDYRYDPRLGDRVKTLINAAHRMVKWSSIHKGEEGGAFIHSMNKMDEAESDVRNALREFGIESTETPPIRIVFGKEG